VRERRAGESDSPSNLPRKPLVNTLRQAYSPFVWSSADPRAWDLHRAEGEGARYRRRFARPRGRLRLLSELLASSWNWNIPWLIAAVSVSPLLGILIVFAQNPRPRPWATRYSEAHADTGLRS
jgi:hypothetical protein